MKNLILFLFCSVGVLITLPIVLVMVWWSWIHFVQSPRFASTFFEDLLDIEDVVESRRWHWGSHPWADNVFGCSYAIASISGNAASTPPANWHADWVETPVAVPEGRHDILGACTYLWPEELNARLIRAHDEPGSYYSSNSETLLLYSPKERIAASIRFGD